jgi:hypothetical protein
LYFDSSDGPDSLFPFGRYGIYVSEWNGSSWTVPVFQWDYTQSPEYPSVTADGQWLYFGGISDIFVTEWTGSGWGEPPYNLRQNLGGRAGHPFITAAGDSLFFTGTPDFGGFGGNDIYLSKRIGPSKAPSLADESLVFLSLVLVGAGIYWTLKRSP